jgi:hypothetical protein
MPTLVFFMFLGILFGCDGLLKISFDDFDLTSKLCSIGLLFIIFYGGFCTKKSDNKITSKRLLFERVIKDIKNGVDDEETINTYKYFLNDDEYKYTAKRVYNNIIYKTAKQSVN